MSKLMISTIMAGLVMLVNGGGFVCDQVGHDACPISVSGGFMPVAYAQETDVCPPEGCPEIPLFQPTAIVTYEWPNGQYYKIPFDPSAYYAWIDGEPYETYAPTLTIGEMQDPTVKPGEMGNNMYRKYSTAITRLLRQLDMVGEIAFYTPIELVHIGDILEGLHAMEQWDGGSGNNEIPGLDHTIRPGEFPSLSAYLMAKNGLLDADLQVVEAALRVEEHLIHPDDVMELRNGISTGGNIARNNRSLIGEIISTDDLMWGFITAPIDILDMMVQLENTAMALPPTFGIFDALEHNGRILLENADAINALRARFWLVKTQADQDIVAFASEAEYGPCYAWLWYYYAGGEGIINQLGAIADEAAQYVISDYEIEENFALRYANWQYHDINGQSRAAVEGMRLDANRMLREVNESGRQCVESWQDIPGFEEDPYAPKRPFVAD